MNGFWDVVEQLTRDALFTVTKPIPNADIAGLVFGVGLVVTDHIYRPLQAVFR